MILLTVVLILALLGLSFMNFLLGFRLGGDHWQRELMRVRLEAAQASRQMGDLTRQAFVTMTEEAHRLRGRSR